MLNIGPVDWEQNGGTMKVHTDAMSDSISFFQHMYEIHSITRLERSLTKAF